MLHTVPLRKYDDSEPRGSDGKWGGGDATSSGDWSHSNKHFAHVSTKSGAVMKTKTPTGPVKVQVGPHPDHATAVKALVHKFPAETKGKTITSGWGLDGPSNDMQWTKAEHHAKAETIDDFVQRMK
jgi:hypothetical protein